MQLPIDEDKWINCIINSKLHYCIIKLKDCFKVLTNEEKISEKEFDSICPVGTPPGISYGSSKVHETVVNGTAIFRPILSLWKKLLRTVSTIYSPIIFMVVD